MRVDIRVLHAVATLVIAGRAWSMEDSTSGKLPRTSDTVNRGPATAEPLALQYIKAQTRNIEKFTSELEFNHYEMAYLILNEIPNRMKPLIAELEQLLGENCHSQWPHMSHPHALTQPCPTSRAKVYQNLAKFQEWVLSSQVFGKKLKKVKEETERMNDQYAKVMKEALKGYVEDPTDPRGYNVLSQVASAPTIMFSNPDRRPLIIHGDPLPGPSYHVVRSEETIVPEAGTGTEKEGTVTADEGSGGSSGGLHAEPPPILVQESGDTAPMPQVPIISQYLNPTDDDFTDYSYDDIPNAAPSHYTSNTLSIRSFFGFPDYEYIELEENFDPIRSKFLHANHSAEETKLILQMALNDPSKTTDVFFFASTLFTLSPALYDTVTSYIPPLVDTIIRAPKYRIDLLQNRTEYRLYMNSSLRMGALRVNPVLDLLIQHQYWKFLPRYNGQYFILFNVGTKSIVGVENAWDDRRLYFKNESNVSVKSFLDQDAPVVDDRFLWILYLECDKEENGASNDMDGSDIEPCAPRNLYLKMANKEFFHLRFALDSQGDIVLRSDDLRPRFEVKA